jgi:hypothetical protein
VHSLYKNAQDSISSGVAELEQWASLTNARGRDYGLSVGKPYENDAVAATKPFIEHGRAALDLSSSRWNDMINSFRGLDDKAKELDKEAKALPDSITCAG